MFRVRTSFTFNVLLGGLVAAGVLVILTSYRCSAGDQAGQKIAPEKTALKYTSDFAWSAAPSDDLSSPGVHKVSVPCAGGVRSNEPNYYILISGSGATGPCPGGSGPWCRDNLVIFS